jgi:hypothetical protein
MAGINAILRKDFILIQRQYPNLRLSKFGKKNKIEGNIHIIDRNEIDWGVFSIEILIEESYPFIFPKVTEKGLRIPKEGIRHIYTNGSCCLTVAPIQIIESKKGLQLQLFFDKYLMPFLYNQIYYEGHGKFANQEYEHNVRGILQYFMELLNTTDITFCIRFLFYFLQKQGKCHLSSNASKFDIEVMDILEIIGADNVKKFLRQILLLLHRLS